MCQADRHYGAPYVCPRLIYRKIPKISPSKWAFEKYKPRGLYFSKAHFDGLIFGILRYIKRGHT